MITSFLGYAAFTISFGVSVLYLILSAEKRKDAFYVVGMVSFVTMMTLFAATIAGLHRPEDRRRRAAAPVRGLVREPRAGREDSSPGSPPSAIFALFWYVGTLYHERLAALFPGLRILDDLSYKMVMVGFPLLTLGIVTGAAWANYAWGTYWSWDPKETWSLITWLIYAAFLHARFTAGWRGKKTAILSVIGFAAVVFTYIGVNFVLSGLHSYG